MNISRVILLLTCLASTAAAGDVRRRKLQNGRVSLLDGEEDPRGGSRLDPKNAGLLQVAAIKKVILEGTGGCGSCDLEANLDWACGERGSHLICHKGQTKCIAAVSFPKHCFQHEDTCGPCANDECGTCEEQGECEDGEIQICHKRKTSCISNIGWLRHCFNHGDTCGACPAEGDTPGNDEDDGNDGDTDEGGLNNIRECATTCAINIEETPESKRCAMEVPEQFPICHNEKTICIAPEGWKGHCLRHRKDTCGPCSPSDPGNGNKGGGIGGNGPPEGDQNDEGDAGVPEDDTGEVEGGNKPENVPTENSNAGGIGGGNGTRENAPPDNSNAGGNGGGNGMPENAPPGNSNAGGDGGGSKPENVPPENSNAGGNQDE